MKIESKQIQNYPNYLIYNNGKVFNIKKGKFQTIRVITSGKKKYHSVVISQDGQATQLYIGRLVAEAFVKNPDPKVFTKVTYIDTDSTNNDYTNIKWTSQKLACLTGNTGIKNRTKELRMG